MDDDRVPVACTLSAARYLRREQRWQAVIAETLQTKTTTPGGVRLDFRPDQTIIHELLDLVIAERDCCAWASWTLISTADAAGSKSRLKVKLLLRFGRCSR